MSHFITVYDGTAIKSQPLGPWTKQDVLRFAYEHMGKKIVLPDGSSYVFDICSVYGKIEKDAQGIFHLTGEQRTGCMYCAFGVTEEKEPNRFQRMQSSHPKYYGFCMKPVAKQYPRAGSGHQIHLYDLYRRRCPAFEAVSGKGGQAGEIPVY